MSDVISANPLQDLSRRYSNLGALVDHQLKRWPEHTAFLKRRFASDDPGLLARTDELAALVLRLTEGELDRYCDDYKWMCQQFMVEDLYFRRHKRYRLTSFAAANELVYSNKDYMPRYLNGMLVSQVLWRNHAVVIDLFRSPFLTGNKPGYDYLEVGPGHGLFAYLAARDANARSLTAWDVSATSIAATQAALARMGAARPIDIKERDVCTDSAADAQYDSIVFSEVLEHLEQPQAALSNLVRSLRHGGRMFLHVPVNSPAPDHIYLWRKPEEVIEMIKGCGLEIEQDWAVPASGFTKEEAIANDMTISCVVIAMRN